MSVPPISALDARSTQSALDDLLSLGVGELVTGDSDQPSSSNFRKDMETSGIVVVPGIPLDGNTSSSTPQDAQTSDDLFSLQVGELGPLLNGGGRDTKSKADFTHIQEDVNPRDHWNIIGELVDGAFGKVEKAVSRTDPMLYAASESIELQEGEELENFSVGIKIMSECTGHPVMMGLYSTYFFDNKLTMLLEFCGGGAVDNILVKLRHSLQEDQIRFIGYYVCDALKWLHSQNVIHRDLKAGNVLLTIDGQVRLAGFRVSAKLKSEREKRGTIRNMAHTMRCLDPIEFNTNTVYLLLTHLLR